MQSKHTILTDNLYIFMFSFCVEKKTMMWTGDTKLSQKRLLKEEESYSSKL